MDEVGCKRIMPTDAWYPTLTRPNVELITDPITAVIRSGIQADNGSENAVDVIIFATGFKTHGFVTPMEITGQGNRTLAQVWALPRAYLGLSVPDFPNLFLLYGPNTGGGAGSVIYMIEAGMLHVISALDTLQQAGARRIEIRQEVADSFDAELCSALAGTVWHSGCTNWYVDENGRDPNQWPWTLQLPPANGPSRSSGIRDRRPATPFRNQPLMSPLRGKSCSKAISSSPHRTVTW